MKRIITIIIALVMAMGIAGAQITIKKSEYERPKMVATLAMSWSWIYQQGEDYYIVMQSDNQYDDSFWLKIGSTKEECLKSVNGLLDLTETMSDTDVVKIDNGEGKQFEAMYYSALGFIGLKFHGVGYAGAGTLLQSNIKKAVKWIEKNLE